MHLKTFKCLKALGKTGENQIFLKSPRISTPIWFPQRATILHGFTCFGELKKGAKHLDLPEPSRASIGNNIAPTSALN